MVYTMRRDIMDAAKASWIYKDYENALKTTYGQFYCLYGSGEIDGNVAWQVISITCVVIVCLEVVLFCLYCACAGKDNILRGVRVHV